MARWINRSRRTEVPQYYVVFVLQPVRLPRRNENAIAWSDSLHRAVLIGDDLPPAPSGKAYELWLITEDHSIAMHILDPGNDGTVHATLDLPHSPSKWAITLEPSAGVEVATGDIIFVAATS